MPQFNSTDTQILGFSEELGSSLEADGYLAIFLGPPKKKLSFFFAIMPWHVFH
jgi:hypothetical protein